MDKIAEAIKILKAYNQDHIIKLLNKIEDKEELLEQIHRIDFHQLMELYESTKKENEFKKKKIEPIKCCDKLKMTEEEIEKYESLGISAIESNQYAVVTMAGGQGTRLGHNGPKGTFKLDIYGKGKYLFEILVEDLKLANEKYGVTIPWYIMTSKENNDETVKFLKQHNYFGYDKEKIKIFKQKELPLLDQDGKVLIDRTMKIKEASDGNGSTYAALRESGALAEMKQNGVKWIFIGSVDNALIKMADTFLLGLSIDRKIQIASKTVSKVNPQEKVGVFCKINGRPGVIEYTELPEKLAKKLDEDGDLMYGESHIMCNLFTIEAIEKISNTPLKYHYAVKKNAYLDENLKEVIPEEPNSFKFEAFIFDAFESFSDFTILRGRRTDDFAPVKNKDGVDSPKTAKELYEKYWEKQNKLNK